MRKAPPEAYGAFLARAEEEFRLQGYRKKNSATVENILIVRMDAIGDMVMTSGFLREVRANFPHARITFVVAPHIYSMLEFCPYVNEVLSFASGSLGNNLIDTLEKIAVFCRDNLWQKKFSLALSPKPTENKGKFLALWMMWLSGARERIGYGIDIYHENPDKSPVQFSDLDNFLLTKNVVLPTREAFTYLEKIFYVLFASGLKINQTHLELFYGATDVQRAKELLEDIPPACKKVALGVGASDPAKVYPVEKLVVALNELLKKNLFFVIVGGKSEIDGANFVERNLPHGTVLNLTGKTSLRETEAVVSQMDFYIGNDTGVMHMAAAAKVPVLVFYRVAKDLDGILYNQYLAFPPYQTKSVVLRPLHRLDDCATLPPRYIGCHHKEAHCITQISPQDIVEGFEQLERIT